MTTPIVPSITDEQLVELEESVVSTLADPDLSDKDVATVMAIGGIIARLRHAEKDAARYRWLRERYFAADFQYGDPANSFVEAMVFKMPDSSIFTAGCDQTIDTAMEQQP